MLNNFDFCVNTNFIFGKDVHKRVGSELKKLGIESVLIHHDDGRYLYETNLLDDIVRDLESHHIRVTEMGGVLPNPRLSLVYEGIERVRKEKISFILAIGGGSVIDSAKAIAAGVLYEGDVWDFFVKRVAVEKTLPVGVVLTCPATGSESSSVSVINNAQRGEKLLASSTVLRPAIVFMNPELTYSLPKFVTACGVIDMFSHTCERYFAPDDEIGVIDRMAEGVLKTLVDIGPKLTQNPKSFTDRAQIMWIGSIAHNNTVGLGRVQDWSTHEIGNGLSALYDTPHGATLSIIMGSWMRYVYRRKPMRFARYAHEIFGVERDSMLKAAEEGIVCTERFFRSMDMPICFADLDIPTDRIDDMLDKIAFRGEDQCIGGIVRLNREDVKAIFQMAF